MLTTDVETHVNPIEILESDHQMLALRFSEFFACSSERQRSDLADSICDSLKIHFSLEADIFYPEFLHATHDPLSHFVASVNRETVQKVIEEIEYSDPADANLTAKVNELSQLVAHHVTEAERPDGGLFVQARASGLDREDLGRALMARRQELVAECPTLADPDA
jgi:hypothetical protein